MSKEKGKHPKESAVKTTELVLPTHTNANGTIFGGTVAAWVDVAAAVAAMRHCRKPVVTASIDALHFISPIRLGQIVQLSATVNYAGTTSMEVGVRVDSEDLRTGVLTHNCTAYATFVALDENRKPSPVPPILPETPEEKRRYEQAQIRRESRIKLKEQLSKH